MGVQFDRLLEPFSGPFERVTDWNVKPPAGQVVASPGAVAYAIDRTVNDAVRVVNRMLTAGAAVRVATPAAPGPEARFFFESSPAARAALQKAVADLGVTARPVAVLPRETAALHRPRVGLWDQYGGSMPSGWTRWILEQFEFPFARVFAPELDAGNLGAKYDVLVFVDGAIPGAGRERAGTDPPADLPEEYRSQVGRVTAARTIPQLRQFVEAGGTIVAIGSSSTAVAAHFGLPVDDHLVEDGAPLPPAKYFVPGSVLGGRVSTGHPLAAGMGERADFFFDNSPVFRVRPDALGRTVWPIASFDGPTPLRSGWAWGQRYLEGGVVALEASLGGGRVVLFGPEILHRAQPHGTFKLFFNALLRAGERR
jgi:hypothetical protein